MTLPWRAARPHRWIRQHGVVMQAANGVPAGVLSRSGVLGSSDAPGTHGALSELADLVAAGNVVILSGAGLSTESGIPDYRGPTGLARRAEPMTYQTFVSAAAARQRYWGRRHQGAQHIGRGAPHAGRHAVAKL